MSRRKVQHGFSLVELLIALVIMSVLIALISGAFDGSRSRAQALIQSMSELGNANTRFKMDTGCYATRPDALFDMETGQDASSNMCNRDASNTWNGPYTKPFPTDTTTGDMLAEKVGSGVVVSFDDTGREAFGVRYYVRATGVPADVVHQALQECNSTGGEQMTEQEGEDAFARFKCAHENLEDDIGDFLLLYDQTR